MKDLIKDPPTITRRVSTYDNLDNLADAFARHRAVDRYEGTRLGRQELHGETPRRRRGRAVDLGDDRPDRRGPRPRPDRGRRGPGRHREQVTSDETGIIVVGIGADKHCYVLADRTGRYSPDRWAPRRDAAYDDFAADVIVAEKNYGGEMVKHTLETVPADGGARIILVDSRRGKAIRAEPIVARYEQDEVDHVGEPGDLADLEDELTSWVPGQGPSPNRVDALVHAGTDLLKRLEPAAISSPNKLMRRHLRAVG